MRTRNHPGGWIAPLSSRSPRCRACPTCGAAANERCWSLMAVAYRRRIDGHHAERKRSNSQRPR